MDSLSRLSNASTSSLVGAMPSPPPLMRAIIVVFGASGDLAKRKTFPSLYSLLKHGFLCQKSVIFGFSRSPMSDTAFHTQITSMIKDDDKVMLAQFKSMITYITGDYQSSVSYLTLRDRIMLLENIADFNLNDANTMIPFICYLAVPPSVFLPVASYIHEYILPIFPSATTSKFRIVVEKPFGWDLNSSKELSDGLSKLFTENQVYRIDHYLGKEMVKNIMMLRFTNLFMEKIWNSGSVDNVQITFKETQGIEGRGGYFDGYGIIRDVMQNHLLQILSLIAMSRPMRFSADDIRDSKVAVLKAIGKIDPDSVILGQYVTNGTAIGYTEDPTVPNDSKTATFAALVVYIDVPTWKNVPFILKCGKGLNEQKTEIRIQLKELELDPQVPRNELVIRVQPREAVYLKLNIKNPGLSMPTTSSFSGKSSPSRLSSYAENHDGPLIVQNDTSVIPSDPFISSEMELTYGDKFSDARIPDAYESLLLDLLNGEQGNFVRRDELDAAWRIFTPLLEAVESRSYPPIPYRFGSRGPVEADELIKQAGFKRDHGYVWRAPRL